MHGDIYMAVLGFEKNPVLPDKKFPEIGFSLPRPQCLVNISWKHHAVL
jgi:hypothetical protein